MESIYIFNFCCFVTDFILFFGQIDSEEWNKTQGQTVLRTWEVESAHNYENNQDIKMVTIF